jgi:hypothetical protein
MLRNRAHSNVSQLLGEEKRVIPEEQTLSVVEDIVGSYPNAFYDIAESELGGFVESVSTLASEEDYRRLVSRYGVRRTDKGFWKFSDSLHAEYFQSRVIDAGYLDYNRIENR